MATSWTEQQAQRHIEPRLAGIDPGGGDYEDIRYETRRTGSRRSRSTGPRCATPSAPQTLIEISEALERAREDPEVGVIVLTGEGPLAFCSGGDQHVRGDTGYLAERRGASAAST